MGATARGIRQRTATMSTMRERAGQAAIDTWASDGHTVADLRDRFLEFAESEVRLAMQPSEQAPGLARAEESLRGAAETKGTREEIIADELDRLRAIVRRLGGAE
jgi:hypothetical protein